MAWVYILRGSSGRHYIGSCVDLDARFEQHLRGHTATTKRLGDTLEIVAKKEVADAIAHAREQVMAGKKLSSGMKDAKDIFPTMMIKITEAGEKTGSLDSSMKDVSEFLDYQVSGSLKTLTALLEPLMIVVVGGLIGGIMLAVIAPIYGLISSVSPR